MTQASVDEKTRVASDPHESNGNTDELDNAQKEPVEAWWRVLGGFLVFFNVWGLPITFGAFQNFYTLEYLREYSASAISWIGTVQGALLIFVGLFSGPLYDLGYWPTLFGTGSFLTVFGMMMLSISTEYYQIFLSQGICVGLGCGLLYVPTLTLIGASFNAKRPIAMGIITSGIALGGIIFTIVYLQLLPRVGFAWTVRVLGFVNLAAFLIAAPTLARVPHTSTPVSARNLFDRAALTDLPFLVFTLSQFFAFLGYLGPLFYIPTFAETALRTGESTALYILIGCQGGSLIGRLLATLPVPVVGTMIPWTFCCAVSGVLCFTWIGVDSLGGFITFAVLYGFFSGALVALPPSIFPTICPDPKKLGSRMGVSWTSTALATLVGTPIAGAITNVEGVNFIGVQVWSGTMLLSSGFLLLLLWILLARKHKRMLI